MGYLNEDGLATLVGKVKGQVVQLTAAEYRQIPAETKNTDNKIYFVEDDDYAYAIDNEPTLNSENLVKSGGVYTYTSRIGTGALTTTAKTLIPAVNELKADVDTLNNGLTSVQNELRVKSVTLQSATSAVSITSQSARLFGNILTFFVTFTLSSQVSIYGNLITLGGKSASAGWILPVYTAGMVPITDQSVYGDSGNTNIRASRNLPAGTYRIGGMILVN